MQLNKLPSSCPPLVFSSLSSASCFVLAVCFPTSRCFDVGEESIDLLRPVELLLFCWTFLFAADFSSSSCFFLVLFCSRGRTAAAAAVGASGAWRCSGSRTICPAGPRPAWRRSRWPFALGCTRPVWWTPTQPLRGKLTVAPRGILGAVVPADKQPLSRRRRFNSQ